MKVKYNGNYYDVELSQFIDTDNDTLVCIDDEMVSIDDIFVVIDHVDEVVEIGDEITFTSEEAEVIADFRVEGHSYHYDGRNGYGERVSPEEHGFIVKNVWCRTATAYFFGGEMGISAIVTKKVEKEMRYELENW